MSELDEAWELALAEAEQRARQSGRGDVADYIALRSSNDLARKAGVDWLLNTLMNLAGEANRAGAGIEVVRQEAHRFAIGNSTMVGTLLTFRAGVRQLMVEAGWPRTPRDGIVHGGGLARAHLRHFGNRALDEELLLMRPVSGPPQWLVLEKTGARPQLSEDHLRRHFIRFLGDR